MDTTKILLSHYPSIVDLGNVSPDQDVAGLETQYFLKRPDIDTPDIKMVFPVDVNTLLGGIQIPGISITDPGGTTGQDNNLGLFGAERNYLEFFGRFQNLKTGWGSMVSEDTVSSVAYRGKSLTTCIGSLFINC